MKPIEVDIHTGYSFAIYVSFVLAGIFLLAAPLLIDDQLRVVFLWTSATWAGLMTFLLVWRRFTEWLVKPVRGRTR